jgi:hypothetical protein
MPTIRIRPQRGLAAAVVVIVVILAIVALILGRATSRSDVDLDRRGATDAALTRVSKAIVEFAALNRRLPCPARGDLDTGDADPVGATANCATPGGVVPWKTLALRREDALDGWGRKVSYRVFSGATGFTQTDGVSMTNCNSSLGTPFDTSLATGTSLCKSATIPPNTPAQFLAARGNMLVVQDLGTARNGNAFVLISHGESGLGAYSAEGGSRSTMPNAAGNEYTNTQAGGTYWIVAHSGPGVDSTTAAYFDDVVAYKPFADLVQGARLSERAWGIPTTIGSATFTGAAIAAAGGDATNFNTGQNSLDFGTFTVTASGSTARNVSYDMNVGAGIGSIGTGSNTETTATINSATNESLRFQFDVPGRYLGITLNRFGDTFGERERVRFYFSVGGSTVTITKTACRNDNNDGVVNYTLAPGGDFDEVVVEARTTQFSTYDSTLVIGAIATCPSSNAACAAPGAIAANDCP